jgi:hypothetical protein
MVAVNPGQHAGGIVGAFSSPAGAGDQPTSELAWQA